MRNILVGTYCAMIPCLLKVKSAKKRKRKKERKLKVQYSHTTMYTTIAEIKHDYQRDAGKHTYTLRKVKQNCTIALKCKQWV